jgi:hypothetical protein
MYRGKVLLERTKNRPTVFEKTFSRQVFFLGNDSRQLFLRFTGEVFLIKI